MQTCQTTQAKAEVFGDRLARAITQLEEHVKPDVVLLDSRAGIHHISAVALTRLDAFAYLFASDSEQTWAGYNALFFALGHQTRNSQESAAILAAGVSLDTCLGKIRKHFAIRSVNMRLMLLFSSTTKSQQKHRSLTYSVLDHSKKMRPTAPFVFGMTACTEISPLLSTRYKSMKEMLNKPLKSCSSA